MLQEASLRLKTRIVDLSEPIISGRFWLVKTTLVAAIISLIFAFPSYDALLTGGLSGATWNAVMAKTGDLGYDVLNLHQFGIGNNAARVNFRLTVPVIAHILRLSPGGIFVMQTLFGILLLGLCAWLGNHISGSRIVGLFIAILVGGLQAGQTSFGEMRGLFDGIALTLILLTLVGRNPLIIGLCAFAAAWTDERTFVAALFVALFFAYTTAVSRKPASDSQESIPASPSLRSFFNWPTLGLIIGLVVYLATRLLYARLFNISQALGGVGISTLLGEVNQIPLGVLFAFKGGWVIVILALAALYLRKQRLFLACYLLALLFALGVSFLAEDISRSTSYLLPCLFVAVLILSKLEQRQTVESVVLTSAAITVVLPSYYIGSQSALWQYPLPVQVARWLLLSRGVKMSPPTP